jgi:hypothetical protein
MYIVEISMHFDFVYPNIVAPGKDTRTGRKNCAPIDRIQDCSQEVIHPSIHPPIHLSSRHLLHRNIQHNAPILPCKLCKHSSDEKVGLRDWQVSTLRSVSLMAPVIPLEPAMRAEQDGTRGKISMHASSCKGSFYVWRVVVWMDVSYRVHGGRYPICLSM